MFEMRTAMSYERQFLFEQLKALREVDETPRPAAYWRDFVGRLAEQFSIVAGDLGLPFGNRMNSDEGRAILAGYIAAAYPSAKRYLIEDCGMPRERVEAYPTAQTVFLTVIRSYNAAGDDFYKWTLLPYWEGVSATKRFEEQFTKEAERIGWSAFGGALFIPAMQASRGATAHAQQAIALVQTVESIRNHGAANGGKLPKSLAELSLPAPVEPHTGKPLEYEYLGDRAVLSGHPMPGLRYRLVLRFAAPASP